MKILMVVSEIYYKISLYMYLFLIVPFLLVLLSDYKYLNGHLLIMYVGIVGIFQNLILNIILEARRKRKELNR